MIKTCCFPDFSFADSQYNGFKLTPNNNLSIFLTSWEYKCIRIEFLNILEFRYELESVPKELYEFPKGLESAKKATENGFQAYSRELELKFYQFEDIESFSFFQIIASSADIFIDNNS